MQSQALLEAGHPSTLIVLLTTSLIDDAEPLRVRLPRAGRLSRDSHVLIDQLPPAERAARADRYLSLAGLRGFEIGTTLVMLSARPSRIRVLIKNDDPAQRPKLVEDLNTMIMEEVERQQGTSEGEADGRT